MKNSNIVYTVSVINQNNEKPVSFVLSATGSVYSFVNPLYNFPTCIRYNHLSQLFEGNSRQCKPQVCTQLTSS